MAWSKYRKLLNLNTLLRSILWKNKELGNTFFYYSFIESELFQCHSIFSLLQIFSEAI